MNQHTDERDAYEHLIRSIPGFNEYLLEMKDDRYSNFSIDLGWHVFTTTRLMSATGAMHS